MCFYEFKKDHGENLNDTDYNNILHSVIIDQ